MSPELQSRVHAATPKFGESRKSGGEKKWQLAAVIVLVIITASVWVFSPNDTAAGVLLLAVTAPIVVFKAFARFHPYGLAEDALERSKLDLYKWLFRALVEEPAEVVWLYRDAKKEDEVVVGHAPTGLLFPLRDKDLEGLLTELARELPHAVVGYSAARAALFKRKPQSFVALPQAMATYRDSANAGLAPQIDKEADRVLRRVRVIQSIYWTIATLLAIAIGQSVAEAGARVALATQVEKALAVHIDSLEQVARSHRFEVPSPGRGFEACRYPIKSFVAYFRPPDDRNRRMQRPGWARVRVGGTLDRFFNEPMSRFGHSSERMQLDEVLEQLRQLNGKPSLVVLGVQNETYNRVSFTLIVNVVDATSGLTICSASGAVAGSASEHQPLGAMLAGIENGRPEWWKSE